MARLAFAVCLIHAHLSVSIVGSDAVPTTTLGHIGQTSSAQSLINLRAVTTSLTASASIDVRLGASVNVDPISRESTILPTVSASVTDTQARQSDGSLSVTVSGTGRPESDSTVLATVFSTIPPTQTLPSNTIFLSRTSIESPPTAVPTESLRPSRIHGRVFSPTRSTHAVSTRTHSRVPVKLQSSRPFTASSVIHASLVATHPLPQSSTSPFFHHSYSNFSTAEFHSSVSVVATLQTVSSMLSHSSASYTNSIICSTNCNTTVFHLSRMISATRISILATSSPATTHPTASTFSVQESYRSSTVYNPYVTVRATNVELVSIGSSRNMTRTSPLPALLVSSRTSSTAETDIRMEIQKRTKYTTSPSLSGISRTHPVSSITIMTSPMTSSIHVVPGQPVDEVETERTTPGFKDIKIQIVFEGNCHKLRSSVQLQMEFWQSLLSVIALKTNNTMLQLSTSDLKPFDMSCYPFSVVFEVKTIVYQNLLDVINVSITNAHFTVPILDEMTLLEYDAISVHDVTHLHRHPHKDETVKPELKHVDVVVMVIAAVMFALMLCIGGIICCRECYKRKRSASFNLLDVPPANIKFDDYALTSISRSRMIYHKHNTHSLDTNTNSSKANINSSNIPLKDFTGRRKRQREQLPVNMGDIHVRTRPVAEGLMVGVTCTPSSSPTMDKSVSSSSSPDNDGVDPTTQHLLGNAGTEHGTSNPNFNGADGQQRVSRMYLIQEDETEQML